MKYRFQQPVEPARQCRSIWRAQLALALRWIEEAPDDQRTEAVHEARKALKRVRALLKLVRGPLGERYSPHNAWLRDIGRELGAARDADTALQTLDALAARGVEASRLRQRLAGERETRHGELDAALFERVADALTEARHALAEEALCMTGFDDFEAGLRREYRRGRRALAALAPDAPPEAFHEFRKRVKVHWYHAQLLEPAWPGPLRARKRELKALSRCLGDEHDLQILRRAAERLAPELPESEPSALRDAVAADAAQLRAQGRRLGMRLYPLKPKPFGRWMRCQWRAWGEEASAAGAAL